MRACIVREIDGEEFMAQMNPAIGLVNLIVLSRGVTESVSVVTEISRIEQCTVLAQTDRMADGEARHSCIVADCGEQVGFVDACHALDGSGRGAHLRVLDVTAGKIGVLVGDDLMYPEASRFLRRAGAEYLVALGTHATTEAVVLARAHAVANGLRVLTCFGGGGFVADYDGSTSAFGGRVVTVTFRKKSSERYLLGLRPVLYAEFGKNF